jgi:hypothetical protein
VRRRGECRQGREVDEEKPLGEPVTVKWDHVFNVVGHQIQPLGALLRLTAGSTVNPANDPKIVEN